MKNLAPLIRKKAIDIGNALLADGYPDDRAIPIAISQAEKWYQEASAQTKRPSNKKQILRNKIRINRINMRGNY